MNEGNEPDPVKVQTWAVLRVSDELDRYEQRLVEEGLIPEPSRLPLRRYGLLVACIHILPLALLAALMGILINFILFNKLLHVGT